MRRFTSSSLLYIQLTKNTPPSTFISKPIDAPTLPPRKGVIGSYLSLHPKDRIVVSLVFGFTGIIGLYLIGDEEELEITASNPGSWLGSVKRFIHWCHMMAMEESTTTQISVNQRNESSMIKESTLEQDINK